MNKLILAAIPAAAFTGYAVYENAASLSLRYESLGSGIRIAHISDIHRRRFGRNNRRITSLVASEKPDLIFITGDLISRRQTRLNTVEKMLRELVKTAPVYIIFGNHEQGLTEEFINAEVQERLTEIIKLSGAKLLRNSRDFIIIGERRLNIIGYEPDYSVYKSDGCYTDLTPVTKEDIVEVLGECPQGETLLLAHNPLFGKAYAEWGADYTFSGHVHGGVVRIFGKGILSPERKFLPKYTKGVYDFGGKKLLVSAGLGKLRLFNPPEIVIYDI